MTNNDVLRTMRFILNVSDAKIAEITALAGIELSPSDVGAMLKRDDEEGYLSCSDQVMAHFLNGLVIFKRGKDENRPPQAIQVPITNNIVIKKIRVAFQLQDQDLSQIIEKSGLKVTKSELSAFFRSPSHRNYRDCGDQFLRNLLKGLA